ncbi:hypothetical protein TNCV_3839881, partial [Trichonephila clavipes]
MGLFHFYGPVYMGEDCRQHAGSNPLCTRLHDDPAKCRLEMQVLFSYPLSSGVDQDSALHP